VIETMRTPVRAFVTAAGDVWAKMTACNWPGAGFEMFIPTLGRLFVHVGATTLSAALPRP
jgi:hypothetical protein